MSVLVMEFFYGKRCAFPSAFKRTRVSSICKNHTQTSPLFGVPHSHSLLIARQPAGWLCPTASAGELQSPQNSAQGWSSHRHANSRLLRF